MSELYPCGVTKQCTRCLRTLVVSRETFGTTAQRGGVNRRLKPTCRECERAKNKRYHGTAAGAASRSRREAARGDRTGYTNDPRLSILIAMQKGRCEYCAHEMTRPSLDHKVPLSRGGLDHMSNLVAACTRCNSNKGAKTDQEYKAYLQSTGNWAAPERSPE